MHSDNPPRWFGPACFIAIAFSIWYIVSNWEKRKYVIIFLIVVILIKVFFGKEKEALDSFKDDSRLQQKPKEKSKEVNLNDEMHKHLNNNEGMQTAYFNDSNNILDLSECMLCSDGTWLCSDGTCIGVINEKGFCKVCGKPYVSVSQPKNSEGNMGLLSNLFGSSSNIEKELEECYIPMMEKTMNMSSQEAKNTFRDLLQQAKDDALKQGTLNLPPNFGDMLLERESYDEGLKAVLAKKRKEGVRDEDIRWWGNMHELERQMMLITDNVFRYAYYLNLIENYGINKEEAMNSLRKTHPMFGDPEDTTHTTGEDRPLHYELKDRINIFIEKYNKSSPANLEKYKKEIEESSSYNAFVRKQIRKENI